MRSPPLARNAQTPWLRQTGLMHFVREACRVNGLGKQRIALLLPEALAHSGAPASTGPHAFFKNCPATPTSAMVPCGATLRMTTALLTASPLAPKAIWPVAP